MAYSIYFSEFLKRTFLHGLKCFSRIYKKREILWNQWSFFINLEMSASKQSCFKLKTSKMIETSLKPLVWMALHSLIVASYLKYLFIFKAYHFYFANSECSLLFSENSVEHFEKKNHMAQILCWNLTRKVLSNAYTY